MMKRTAVYIILGHNIYMPSSVPGERWSSHRFEKVEDVADLIAERGIRRVRFIYEPADLHTEEIDIPRARRGVLVNIPDLRNRFTALGTDTMGWGFQAPIRGRTLLHAENGQGLYALVDRLSSSSIVVEGAWAASTLGFGQGFPGGVSLSMLLDDEQAHLYVEARGARHSHRYDSQYSQISMWNNLRSDLDNHGLISGTAQSAFRLYSNMGSMEQLAAACPWWQQMATKHRPVIEDFDAVATKLLKFKTSANSNLVGSFPRPFDLTQICKAVIALAAVGLLALGATFANDLNTKNTQLGILQADIQQGQNKLAQAKARKAEQDKLTYLFGDDIKVSPPSRVGFLRALGAVFPVDFSISNLRIDATGQCTIEGLVWGTDDGAKSFDKLLKTLGDNNYSVEPARCAYDAQKRTFIIGGKLNRQIR
jgi:hypothetical protein